MYIFLAGVLTGIVGTITVFMSCVIIEYVETGKDGKIMKDCFKKPIKVVNICNIRPGDFIHDISYSSLIDSEKRKGYVVSARRVESGQVALRLQGRKTTLDVPIIANAVITPAASGIEQLKTSNEKRGTSPCIKH